VRPPPNGEHSKGTQRRKRDTIISNKESDLSPPKQGDSPNLQNRSPLRSRRTLSNIPVLDAPVIQNENRSTNTSPQRMTITAYKTAIGAAKAFLNRIKTLKEKRLEERRETTIMHLALRNETVNMLSGFIHIVRSNISKLIENPNYLQSHDVHSYIFMLQNFVQEINSHIAHITIEIGLLTPIPYLAKDIYAEKISKLTSSGGKKNVTRRKRK
jgi:hypothetical protein